MSKYVSNILKILDNGDLPEGLRASSPAKISVKKNNAFAIPAGKNFGCIGETDVCASKCYAKKGNHLWPAVQNLLARNWKLLKHFEANADSEGAVRALLEMIPEKAELFRIHESGDFFSQWYVDVWAEAIAARPNTKFWFYTRSFTLDFSGMQSLRNATCWASTDSANENEALAFVKNHSFFRHAYGPIAKNEEKPEGSFFCPATVGKLETAGACEKCRLCTDSRTTKHVAFRAH
jgi:hypothetical protein